ncbi:hypothetical protein NRIC_20740 [Enterococcus florum]|uniref:Uncharacterized protein n=1 Tax=Enterococcus florum TaxID=2480627 RepID=A0A4P5PLN7_9ENTE|nr:hypothetical protein NRIC_20740 [Enterococcus florum]
MNQKNVRNLLRIFIFSAYDLKHCKRCFCLASKRGVSYKKKELIAYLTPEQEKLAKETLAKDGQTPE